MRAPKIPARLCSPLVLGANFRFAEVVDGVAACCWIMMFFSFVLVFADCFLKSVRFLPSLILINFGIFLWDFVTPISCSLFLPCVVDGSGVLLDCAVLPVTLVFAECGLKSVCFPLILMDFGDLYLGFWLHHLLAVASVRFCCCLAFKLEVNEHQDPW